MELKDQIKAKRKLERLSAEDLGIKLGLKRANIYKWERGAMPSDPEEYKILTNWLNNVESGRKVPGEDIYRDKYIAGLEKDKELFAEVIKANLTALLKITEKTDANLSKALGGVHQLSLHVESAREVVLESLTRLEKKKPGDLRSEADNIVKRLMKEQSKLGIQP